jgi:hypothetical protein
MKVVAFSILLRRKTYTHTHIYKRQGWGIHKKYKANKSSRTPVAKEHNKSHETTQDTTNTLINKKTGQKRCRLSQIS